jgi:hypothetical protein
MKIHSDTFKPVEVGGSTQPPTLPPVPEPQQPQQVGLVNQIGRQLDNANLLGVLKMLIVFILLSFVGENK